MSNQQYEEYARALAQLYEDAEIEMLETVAKRLARGIEQPGWAERKLGEVKQLREHTSSILQKYLKGSKILIEEAMMLSYTSGAGPGFDNPIGIRTKQEAVFELVQDLVYKLNDAGVQVLRKTEDIYRSTVADALRLSVSGIFTRKQATQRALEGFASKGISGFVDKAGRQWDIASYAEMAARTGYQRAHLSGNLTKYSTQGRDLVVVSVSPEPCSICDPFEGKVFSISGSSTKYPPLQRAIGAGLFHPNCTHRITPYIEGLTRPYTPADKYNKEGVNKYDERQEQRRLERKVRAAKRVEAVALDEPAKKAAGKKVRAAQKELRAFIKDTGRLRQRSREQLFDAVKARAKSEDRLARRVKQAPDLDAFITAPEPAPGRKAKAYKQWAEHHYPDTVFDIEDLDDRAAYDVVSQLHILAQDWGGVLKSIKYVGTQGQASDYPFDWGNSSAFAHMSRANYYLGLNPKWFSPGNYEQFLDEIEKWKKDGWLVAGRDRNEHLRAIVVHEFGHAVENFLRTSKATILSTISVDGIGAVADTLAIWTKKFGLKGTAKSLSSYAVYKGKKGSDTRLRESWAESFVLQYLPRYDAKPGAYQRAQRKLLDALHPSRWVLDDYREANFLRDVPEVDRQRAKEALEQLRKLLDLEYY